MIYDHIELHNTVEIEPAVGGGVALRRFSKGVRECLSPLGSMVAQESAGCELRFVSDAENLRVAVSSMPPTLSPWEEHRQDAVVFKGAFFHSRHCLEAGKINHLNLTDIGGSEKRAFAQLKPDVRDTRYFHHDVWRVMFGRYPAVFHEIETYGHALRPPKPKELPQRSILFYGSSITNGASPSLYHLCYVQQTARYLQADAINLGLSGACLCEKQMADYLARRDDWAAICLEIGVNMRGVFTPKDFEFRSRYLVGQIIGQHPDKPIFLITILPNAQSPKNAGEVCNLQRNQVAFNDILRKTVEDMRHPHLHLVEGDELFADYTGVTRDLIHPGDYGHAEIAIKLAGRMRRLL